MHFNGDQKTMPEGANVHGGVNEGFKSMSACEYAEHELEYALFIHCLFRFVKDTSGR